MYHLAGIIAGANVAATPVVADAPAVKKEVQSKSTDFDAAGNFVGQKDDLTKVEGIGPKVQSHLNDAGIYTWAQLANTEVNKIKSILEAQGGIYANMVPGTWPEQAKMADEGRWDELKKWQDELDGGK